MVYIDPVLTAFALLPSFDVRRDLLHLRQHPPKKRRQATSSGAVSSFVQQHIAGMRVLKSFHREKAAAARFDVETDLYKMRVLDLVKVEAMFMPLIVLLVGLSTILTVYVGGHRVAAGHLDLGHIFQFVFYVNLLTWPFASVGWVTSLVQKAEASMARILDFLHAQPAVQSTPVSRTTPLSTTPSLTFDNVSWTPRDRHSSVDSGPSVKAGETLGITGEREAENPPSFNWPCE